MYKAANLLILISLCSVLCNDWKQEPAGPDRPSVRGGARLVNAGGNLFYLGGFFECFTADGSCDHEWKEDLWHYDTNDRRWNLINPTTTTGSFPSARAFFGANYWEEGEVVVVYGGIRYNVTLSQFNPFGDLWFYSAANQAWTQVSTVNVGPGVRIAPNVAIFRNEMYVFGGLKGNFQIANDMWKLDLESLTWTELIPNDAVGSPSPRYLTAFRLDKPSKTILMHGGNIFPAASGNQSPETWAYSIRDNEWTQIETPFLGRIHGAYEVINRKFVLAFGDIENVPGQANGCRTPEASAGQNPTDEVRQLQLSNNEWTQLTPAGGPGPLKRVASTTVGNSMFVVGGYNFECPEGPEVFGFATWNTNLYSLKI
jgi:hypothetical protein